MTRALLLISILALAGCKTRLEDGLSVTVEGDVLLKRDGDKAVAEIPVTIRNRSSELAYVNTDPRAVLSISLEKQTENNWVNAWESFNRPGSPKRIEAGSEWKGIVRAEHDLPQNTRFTTQPIAGTYRLLVTVSRVPYAQPVPLTLTTSNTFQIKE